MRCSLLWDVSGVYSPTFRDHIGLMFKDQAVRDPLKVGPIGNAETSVSTNQRRVTSQKREDVIVSYFLHCTL